MKSLNTLLRRLQQRLGAREELIAGIALGLLASGGLAFTLVTNQGTPAGAALAYMAAVDRADTAYVWTHSMIDSSATRGLILNASLLDRTALAAQLAASAHTRSGFKVQDVHFDNQYTKVTLAFTSASGHSSASLEMRGEAPHQWSVVLRPSGIRLLLPPGEVTASLDGHQLANRAAVAILPGLHKISLPPSDRYEAFTGQVEADSALPDLTVVSFAGVHLTSGGITEADQAVASAFGACARSTQLSVQGCPQVLPEEDVAKGNVTWTVLGDPLAGSSVRIDDKTSDIEVTGHFLMELSYDSQAHHSARQLGVGSPYAARLTLDGAALTVLEFGDASAVPDLPRPDATDSQVLAALRAQFDACLKLQVAGSAGCPQSVAAFYASNLVWHENSDPLQGATLVWDGHRGIFTVAGTFNFSVEYDSTPPFSPTRHYQDHSSGQYVADLYWDGSKVVFVGLEK